MVNTFLVVYNDENGDEDSMFFEGRGTVSQVQDTWIECFPFFNFIAITVV